ncbi:MAG: NAD(P)/FAD-dependent oxidoreductase, partial [Planctomycetota bacterium]
PTNSVGMLDLNSVAIGTSPAYSLEVEHPTGRQFAAHLRDVADYFELPVQEGVEVLRVTRYDDGFRVDTPEETLRAKNVIWAAGEFQVPPTDGLDGLNHCRHTATIGSYNDLEGDEFAVIGGYESGVDAAYHLARRGKKVQLFDGGNAWDEQSSDPSISLSTFTRQRTREDVFKQQVTLIPETFVTSVVDDDGGFEISALDGRTFRSPTAPLYAGGFAGGHQMVADLFERRPDGFPLLTERDESTITPGLFLCGPTIRHDNHVFCFIFKFRQRFAVVAKAIADSLGLAAEELETYRQWGMYLDDLSCCGEECAC